MSHMHPRPANAPPHSNAKVFFEISIADVPIGRIVFKLFDDIVPNTATNFRELALGSYGFGYKGSIFFRIAQGQFIKGGDITHNDGTGGRSIYGHQFCDENYRIKNTKPYMLSMATRGPHTNSSQFFITTCPATWCDGMYVVFGEVVDGFDVIKKIDGSPTRDGSTPTQKIHIADCGIIAD